MGGAPVQPFMGGSSRITLAILQRGQDTLRALDLLGRIRDMAARLRADHEQRRKEAAELRALQAMTDTELASSLQQLEN